jgi:hypothetical protein
MYTLKETQLDRIALAVAGRRVTSKMVPAVQTHYLDLVIRAHLSVTVNGTGLINRGSILAALEEIGVTEAGDERQVWDGRTLGFYAETSSPSALTRTRATVATVQETDLVEHVRLYFAHPFAAKPREVVFMEKNPRSDTNVFAKLAATAAAKLVVGGTAALTAITVDIAQVYDETEAARPYFIPSVRQVVHEVNGVNGAAPEFLRVNNFLRGIILQQETEGAGEVNDIINRLVFRGSTKQIIGPDMRNYNDLVRAQEYEFGGSVGPSVAAGGGAYVLLNFQKFGKLSNVLNPAQDLDLRFLFDQKLSAAVGAVSSRIRITLLELEHDPSARDVNGRPLVKPIDFQI